MPQGRHGSGLIGTRTSWQEGPGTESDMGFYMCKKLKEKQKPSALFRLHDCLSRLLWSSASSCSGGIFLRILPRWARLWNGLRPQTATVLPLLCEILSSLHLRSQLGHCPSHQAHLSLRLFHWSQEVEAAFYRLKFLFTSAPILSHPDPSRQFVIEVDAFDRGVVTVLSLWDPTEEKLHPCASFQPSGTGNSHRATSPGVEALVGGQFLLPFTVWTDHKNLSYLRNAKWPNSRQVWGGSLSGSFWFFPHLSAPKMLNQTWPHQFCTSSISAPLLHVGGSLLASRGEGSRCPVDWNNPWRGSQPSICPRFRSLWHPWVETFIPTHPSPDFIQTFHFPRQELRWPSMSQDAKAFISVCPVCAQGKLSNQCLKLPSSLKIHPTFHLSLLKKTLLQTLSQQLGSAAPSSSLWAPITEGLCFLIFIPLLHTLELQPQLKKLHLLLVHFLGPGLIEHNNILFIQLSWKKTKTKPKVQTLLISLWFNITAIKTIAATPQPYHGEKLELYICLFHYKPQSL